ncbi:MAG: DMT family transporter [Laribacter sp.]|nr:DMT family transporter [Laribacter sp.]MBP9609752.1 DMT family transporter [Laribacter sp.]
MSSLHLARLLALVAIFIWASLAALGVKLAHLPPFLLVGLTLAVAGIASLPTRRSWRVPARTFALGTGGLFGYHFFLFLAFRNAPAIEANLINYLWPLLIVLLSPFLFPGLRLGLPHIMAGFAGFVGAALVVSKGRLAFEADYLPGYLAAMLAAFLWAGYSLATRKLPPFPTAAVGGFCLASGALSLLCHVLLEPQVIPAWGDVLWLLLLGLGPMGGAFFLWDRAMKLGDPREIGLLSFLTPLLSTLLLVVSGGGRLDQWTLLGGGLILGAALVGALAPPSRQTA